MIHNILVVCVGNICRSPMAEGLLKNRAASQPALVLHSAGLGALIGETADPFAQKEMRARGVDIGSHRARQIDLEMVNAADLILVMEKKHLQHMHAIFPMTRGKVHLLGKWNDIEIPDPYRKSEEVFAATACLIEDSVSAWSSKLWKDVK